MSFIVSQNGKVYSNATSARIPPPLGAKMTTFDPGPGWKEVR